MLSDKLHSERTQLYQPLSMPREEITEVYCVPFNTHKHLDFQVIFICIFRQNPIGWFFRTQKSDIQKLGIGDQTI